MGNPVNPVKSDATVDGVAVVAPTGRMDAVTAPTLRDDLHALIERGYRRILVDLSGVTCLSSAGLGALIAGLKAARVVGGDVRIVAPNQRVRAVLDIAGLLGVFTPYESADAATAGWA